MIPNVVLAHRLYMKKLLTLLKPVSWYLLDVLQIDKETPVLMFSFSKIVGLSHASSFTKGLCLTGILSNFSRYLVLKCTKTEKLLKAVNYYCRILCHKCLTRP